MKKNISHAMALGFITLFVSDCCSMDTSSPSSLPGSSSFGSQGVLRQDLIKVETNIKAHLDEKLMIFMNYLNAKFAAMDAALTTLNGCVGSGMPFSVGQIEGKVVQIESKVGQIESKVGKLSKAVDNIKNGIGTATEEGSIVGLLMAILDKNGDIMKAIGQEGIIMKAIGITQPTDSIKKTIEIMQEDVTLMMGVLGTPQPGVTVMGASGITQPTDSIKKSLGKNGQIMKAIGTTQTAGTVLGDLSVIKSTLGTVAETDPDAETQPSSPTVLGTLSNISASVSSITPDIEVAIAAITRALGTLVGDNTAMTYLSGLSTDVSKMDTIVKNIFISVGENLAGLVAKAIGEKPPSSVETAEEESEDESLDELPVDQGNEPPQDGVPSGGTPPEAE
jgi:outer membrane murein-binding lipoprotein Lpp